MKHGSTIPSYGAVIIQKINQTPEGRPEAQPPAGGGYAVLMCGGYHGWSFPKGHQEEGELPEETARREVFEETGIRAVIDTSFSRTVGSALPQDRRTITFFLGTCSDGMPVPVPQISEVGNAAWIPVALAPGMIAYEPDRAVFEDAMNYLGIRTDETDVS